MTGRALAATRQRQGGQPTPGCLDGVQQILTTHETMVRSPGSVFVSSVVDVKHDDFVLVLVDSVQDTVGAASRRMDAGEVPAKSPTNAVQVLHQGSRNKLDDRRCYGLGSRDWTARMVAGGVRNQLVGNFAHERRSRTASTPRRTSPAA